MTLGVVLDTLIGEGGEEMIPEKEEVTGGEAEEKILERNKVTGEEREMIHGREGMIIEDPKQEMEDLILDEVENLP